MSYASLAVKYRPKKWGDVVGQDDSVSRLKGMINSGKINRAILFIGTSGVGKTTLAKMFASYANSEDGNPCEINPLDFKEVNAADNRGIDDVRALIEESKYMPSSGKYRFIFLDEAQDLTPAASKALLLPLENPPANTIYILSSMEAEKLLPALAARCSVFDLKLPNAEQVAERLKYVVKKEKIDYLKEKHLLEIALASGGQVRNAISILESVIQYVEGEKDNSTNIKDIIKNALEKTTAIQDEVVAIKILLSIYAGNVASTHATILDASDYNTLIQKLTYLNLFLLDHVLANGHKNVWYTQSNKKLLAALTEKYELKSLTELMLTVQSELNKIKLELGTFLATDRAIFSARLGQLTLHAKRWKKENL